MQKQNTSILERVDAIEKSLQALKVEYFFNLPEKQKKRLKIYKDRDIVNAVRKIRKMLWNGKYSKAL